MIGSYFKSLYCDTMERAYSEAHDQIASAVTSTSHILDCGANNGYTFDILSKKCAIEISQYSGIEWNAKCAAEGRSRGLDIKEGNLNVELPYNNNSFACVYALSVIEHLLNPCRFLKECYRVLQPGGRIIILTPNISTYFTAALIVLGKMPSSGPHPDSDELLKTEEIFKVSSELLTPDVEENAPLHRHLIVFSYKVLKRYLAMIGFEDINGRGFGLYPFPLFTQRILERFDPYHCHQMVFIAQKSSQ